MLEGVELRAMEEYGTLKLCFIESRKIPFLHHQQALFMWFNHGYRRNTLEQQCSAIFGEKSIDSEGALLSDWYDFLDFCANPRFVFRGFSLPHYLFAWKLRNTSLTSHLSTIVAWFVFWRLQYGSWFSRHWKLPGSVHMVLLRPNREWILSSFCFINQRLCWQRRLTDFEDSDYKKSHHPLTMGEIWSKLYPPTPQFTENELPNLAGKVWSCFIRASLAHKLKPNIQVYIVTGSDTGIGKELTQILYAKNAKVYVAARSEEKAKKAIESIKVVRPLSKGELIFMHLNLADLATIKTSVDKFLAKESKLHVLFNNAGQTAQGYELQLSTNCMGHFLLTKMLTPIMIETAKKESLDTIRAVWVSSMGAELLSPKPGGIPMDNLDYHVGQSPSYKYGVTKAGNYLHATEYARRHEKDGIVSVAVHPGMLNSDIGQYMSTITNWILKWLFLYPPIFGAYTELFAGLSLEVTIEKMKICDWSEWFVVFSPRSQVFWSAYSTRV